MKVILKKSIFKPNFRMIEMSYSCLKFFLVISANGNVFFVNNYKKLLPTKTLLCTGSKNKYLFSLYGGINISIFDDSALLPGLILYYFRNKGPHIMYCTSIPEKFSL